MRLLAFSPLLNTASSFLTNDHVHDGSTCSISRRLNKSSAVQTTFRRHQRWHQLSSYGQVDDYSDVEQTHQLPIQSYWKLPRLYVSPSRLAKNAIFTLSAEQTHYLTKVMRFFKKGKSNNSDGVVNRKDFVRVFNGHDGEWLAKVYTPSQSDVDNRKRRRRRDEVTLLEVECLVELRKQSSNDDDRPWIIFAPLKTQSRMKLMIEKCTELGVGAIILAKSDRMDGSILSSLSVPSNGSDNLDHVYGTKAKTREEDISVEKLKLQAIEASEQSERLCIPSITTDFSSIIDVSFNTQNDMFSVKDIVKLWRSDLHQENTESRKLLICRERGEESNTVKPLLAALGETEKVAFLIGPEGGWSREELTLFDHVCQKEPDKNPPIQCVSLGSSVLRAETACMMAVGAWELNHDLSQNK